MKKNQFIQRVGYLTAVFILALPGCARQSTSSSPASGEVVIAPPVDRSIPAMPVATPALVAEPEIAERVVLEPVPATGSVASVLQKMETSPYTLYWKEKDTYTYYIGGLLDAEYQPGVGLVVKDDSTDDASLKCKYDDGGSLSASEGDADKKQEMKEACSQLMFTLDAELSD